MDTINPVAAIRSHSDDPRRARILEGAMKVVLAYGFHRTTMDDIARAAEVSRPALYLQFRNKTDIYRAVTRCILTQCLGAAKTALSADGPLPDRLNLLIENALVGTLCEIEESPHGPELLDMKNNLAADIIAEWRREMDATLEAALADEAQRTGVDLAARDLSARILAETFLDAMEGMKERLGDSAANLNSAKAVARVLLAALRP